MVETSPSIAGSVGSTPAWLGSWDPTYLMAKKEKKKHQSMKQKQYCNKFNKDKKKMLNVTMDYPVILQDFLFGFMPWLIWFGSTNVYYVYILFHALF